MFPARAASLGNREASPSLVYGARLLSGFGVHPPSCVRIALPPLCAASSTDRAPDYGSGGWGFESLAARTKAPGQRPGAVCFACLLIILAILGRVIKEPPGDQEARQPLVGRRLCRPRSAHRPQAPEDRHRPSRRTVQPALVRPGRPPGRRRRHHPPRPAAPGLRCDQDPDQAPGRGRSGALELLRARRVEQAKAALAAGAALGPDAYVFSRAPVGSKPVRPMESYGAMVDAARAGGRAIPELWPLAPKPSPWPWRSRCLRPSAWAIGPCCGCRGCCWSPRSPCPPCSRSPSPRHPGWLPTAGATPVWLLGSFAVLSLLYRAQRRPGGRRQRQRRPPPGRR